MRLKEILIISMIFCILPSLVVAEESYDVYAEKGIINLINGIDISKYVSTKNTFSGLFYSTDSGYKGQASLYTSGYLSNGKKQSVSIVLIMDNVIDCDNLDLTHIFCYGSGKMIIMNPKSMKGSFIITNFAVEVLDGKVDISGRNLSDEIFRITGMIAKKFYPGFVVVENDSTLELTWMNIPQPKIDPPGVFPNILNFTPGNIGNTTYAKNNVWLKNVGNNSIKIYVCGEDYPGIVEFLIKSGTRIFGWQTLPVCDSFQPFNNGIQIVPNIYGNTTLPPGKEIVIYNSRITYTQNYTLGGLNFTVVPV